MNTSLKTQIYWALTNLISIYTDEQLTEAKHERREYYHSRGLSSMCDKATLIAWINGRGGYGEKIVK